VECLLLSTTGGVAGLLLATWMDRLLLRFLPSSSLMALALPAAWLLMGLVQAQLFGVKPHDPASLAAAAGILGVAALLAGYLPVRRVAAIEPMAALRTE
jgi:ABC-type antimicrobial peptide transport system permease subunit